MGQDLLSWSTGRDTAGYQTMLAVGRRFADRVWAVEGCNGIGRHIAQRLVADGEPVVDVPAKLSARARAFATGQGRKTDPVDAHSVAVAALRSKGLRPVVMDDATVALRLLVDRRDGLGRARVETVGRLHKLLQVPVRRPGPYAGSHRPVYRFDVTDRRARAVRGDRAARSGRLTGYPISGAGPATA